MLEIFAYNGELPLKLTGRRKLLDEKVTADVRAILRDVKERGNEAVFEYTKRFDGVSLDSLRVPDDEIDEAASAASPQLLDALEAAAGNIRAFHERQARQSLICPQPGRLTGQLILPLDSVGVYVPGGTAAYPSSVLMNVIPAMVAGVKRIVMATPPGPDGRANPAVLAAARLAGVGEIYKMGGAQAIGALAYGTQTIRPVAKIVGPGNRYVACAKRWVYGDVGIDMIAGPSEVLVVADESANPRYVAADLLSQAEHDPLAAAILITTQAQLAQDVCRELEIQLETLPRREIAAASLRDYGAALIVSDIAQAMEAANAFAPEHLELCVAGPFEALALVRNAGSVFLGNYSPEPLGDYLAGPNHVLPTSGTALFSSPLGVDDFVKRASFIHYSRDALADCAEHINILAKAEGLDAHARAVNVRMEGEGR